MTTKLELRMLANAAIAAHYDTLGGFVAWRAFSDAGNDMLYSELALKAARDAVPEARNDADGRAFNRAYADAYIAAFDEAESNYRKSGDALLAADRELIRVTATRNEAFRLHCIAVLAYNPHCDDL